MTTWIQKGLIFGLWLVLLAGTVHAQATVQQAGSFVLVIGTDGDDEVILEADGFEVLEMTVNGVEYVLLDVRIVSCVLGEGDDYVESACDIIRLFASGGPGNDLLIGGGIQWSDGLDAADLLDGGPGQDVLIGQGGADELRDGEDGEYDVLVGGDRADTIYYDEGIDLVVPSYRLVSIDVLRPN